MKLKSLLIFTISLIVFFCSCKHESLNSISNMPENEIMKSTESDESFISFNLPFPEGTIFEIVDSALLFTLPQPYYLVGIDERGAYHQSPAQGLASGSITCNCTQGSGCDPIKKGDDYGCLMKNNCSECKKSTASIKGVQPKLTEIIILNPNDNNILITSFSQIDEKKMLPAKFIEHPSIKNFVISLLSEVQSIQYPNSQELETKVLFANVYGYIVPIELLVEDNTSISASGITCNCNVSSTCPKESSWGVIWCNSNNCTSCTMSGIMRNANGETKQFYVKNGKIKLLEM